MDDARHRELAARVLRFSQVDDPQAVLEDDALALATELLASMGERPGPADAQALHTVAAFYWARSLVDQDRASADRDFDTSVNVFGMLYKIDPQLVPTELWRWFADEPGQGTRSDPLERARDLVVDGADLQALDEAISLAESVPDSGDNADRDTVHGQALKLRAALTDRADTERSTDADAAVALLGRVAALPESSAARRADRGVSLAEALAVRFDLAEDIADFARAETAYRDTLAGVAENSPAHVRAAAGLGTLLARQARTMEPQGDGVDDAEPVLREAIGYLRHAVDVTRGNDHTANLAALRRAMRLFLERTARVRRAREIQPPRDDEDPENAPAAHPDTSLVRAQVDALTGLSSQLAARVVTEDEALRRVKDPSLELSEAALASVLVGAEKLLIRAGEPREAIPALTLVLEAARVRWGARPGTPWWWAADVYVNAARLALPGRPDGLLFRRAREVVEEQIALLRDQGADGVPELAQTLFAAGLLCTTPFLPATTERLTAKAAQRVWRERQEQRGPTDTDGYHGRETAEMPSPSTMADVALRYLHEAAGLSRGHERGRVLKAVAEALFMKSAYNNESHTEEIQAAAREAFDLLDPVQDTLGYLYILRVLLTFNELSLPGDLDAVLPLPLAVVQERHGEHEAAAVFTEGLTLTSEAKRPDLEFQLIEAANRDLPDLLSSVHRSRKWASEVHFLEANRLDCPGRSIRVEETVERLRAQADREGWSPEERAATFIHIAAHSERTGLEHIGLALVREARELAPEHCRRCGPALYHLDGALSYEAGIRRVGPGKEALAARYLADSLIDYAACHQTDLALRSLEAAWACVGMADEDVAIEIVAVLLQTSVWLPGGIDETVAWKLRDLYQQLAHTILGGVTISYGLMTALHQAAKGIDFTVVARRPGPFTPSTRLSQLLARVRDEESRLPGPLTDPELPGPEDAMLFYAGVGESEPESDPATTHRNSQRAADRWLSQELVAAGSTDQIPMMFPDELQPLLPEDTVLLSLYLCQASRRGSGTPVTALSGMAMSRDRMEHHTVLISGLDSTLMRFSRAGHNLSVHPIAFDVAGLRSSIIADPLHRHVSREAQKELGEGSDTYLAGFAPSLDDWWARGKRHLCIWPNGPLHYLPYHLLEANGRIVAEKWTVTQVPSLGFLRAPSAGSHHPPGRGLVAFASAAGGVLHGLPRQDALEAHASQVASAMGGRAILGSDATPRRLITELVGARYVHLAAHGAHNEWASWYQCLFLSPDSDGDGRVFAYDILQADLRGVELVTMSSCESALGRFDVIDNLRGLPAAFLSAGASAVIGCLWPVHPQVATDFFGLLYERLAENPDRRAAFRAAQLATRRRHPAFRDWGSFCFIGDWRSTRTNLGVDT